MSSLVSKDTVWHLTDSTGQVVSRYGNTLATTNEKRKMRFERRIIRNSIGLPVEEVLEKYEDKASSPCFIMKKNYDDLGRVVEEKKTDRYVNPGRYKRVWKYFRDTELWSYYAV